MDTLRLKNVRSLIDTGEVNLRPISLLVGKNSSGKSSFLRSLPLIKQSALVRSTAPILWYGEYVDFGSISETRTKGKSDEPISFEFGFNSLRIRLGSLYEARRGSYFISHARALIELTEIEGRTRLAALEITADEDRIRLVFDARGNVASVFINGEERVSLLRAVRLRVFQSEIIPQISYFSQRSGEVTINRRGYEILEAELIRYLRTFVGNRISDQNLVRMARKIRYSSYGTFSDALNKSRGDLVTWNNFISYAMTKGTPLYDTLHAYYLLMTLPELTLQLGKATSYAAGGIAYIGPSRATGERYYRFQELGIEQIDPQGRNLAMFLNSMPRGSLSQFSEWMTEAMGYGVKLERSAGHIQVLLQEAGSSEYFNLADIGYGLSQILPILAQIWSSRSRRPDSVPSIVAIEQPELHLHPAYQARLANLFAGIIQSSFLDVAGRQETFFRSEIEGEAGQRPALKLVIETHSETMINRFGELVAAGRISPNDIAVYRFNKFEPSDLSEVKTSQFLSDGTLDSWPIGFFSADLDR